jgi:hypothetical protein
MRETTSQAQVPSCPHCGGKQFFRSKRGCCFKTLIAARPAMVASFVPATVIITGNNYTTTTERNRSGIGVYGKKRGQCTKLNRFGRRVTAICQNEEKRTHAQTSILRPLSYLWCLDQEELCAAFGCPALAASLGSEVCRH